MEFLKVSSKSSPSSVAGAIAGMIKDGVPVEIQSVGAGAVNQAVKAIAIARGFLAPVGIEIVCAPAFADICINGEDRTAIRFTVEPRYLRGAVAIDVDEEPFFDFATLGASFSES
jgi:stage V sporulation protein S